MDKNAKCRNSNIVEEAGQVQYVLSDKTGTLTQNKMELLKCVIGGQAYGEGVTEIEMVQAQLNNEILQPFAKPEVPGEEEGFEFYDKALSGGNWHVDTTSDVYKPNYDFWTALALCNTVFPQAAEDGSIKYSAESPDGQ